MISPCGFSMGARNGSEVVEVAMLFLLSSISFYSNAEAGRQLAGDRLGIRRCVPADCGKAHRRLDGVLPGDHHCDLSERILFRPASLEEVGAFLADPGFGLFQNSIDGRRGSVAVGRVASGCGLRITH